MMGTTVSIFTLVAGASQAKAQREEGKFTSQVQAENARIAEMQAEDAIVRGTEAATDKRLEIKALIGAQRASMGAQGIEINELDSSAGALQLSTREQGEIDALTIKNNAAREAWGYKTQSMNYLAQSRLAKTAGENKGFQTILTSGIQAYGISTGGLSVPKSRTY